MAPEVFALANNISSNLEVDVKKADLFSLGAIILAIITKALPLSNGEQKMWVRNSPIYKARVDQQEGSLYEHSWEALIQNFPQHERLLKEARDRMRLDPKERPC